MAEVTKQYVDNGMTGMRDLILQHQSVNTTIIEQNITNVENITTNVDNLTTQVNNNTNDLSSQQSQINALAAQVALSLGQAQNVVAAATEWVTLYLPQYNGNNLGNNYILLCFYTDNNFGNHHCALYYSISGWETMHWNNGIPDVNIPEPPRQFGNPGSLPIFGGMVKDRTTGWSDAQVLAYLQLVGQYWIGRSVAAPTHFNLSLHNNITGDISSAIGSIQFVFPGITIDSPTHATAGVSMVMKRPHYMPQVGGGLSAARMTCDINSVVSFAHDP